MKLRALLIAIAGLTFLTASFADNPAVTTVGNNVYINELPQPTNPGKGFYIGGDLGAGNSKCNNCAADYTNDPTVTYSSTERSGLVADVFGGYQFNPYVAVETGFGSLPSVKIKMTNAPWAGPYVVDYSATAGNSDIFLAAKGMLPINNKFSLFGKFGFAFEQIFYNDQYNNSVITNTNGIYAALGASYYFSPHWSGLVSFNRVATSGSGTKLDNNFVNLGFSYLLF